MNADHTDLITVGRIAGVFGVKGWLKAQSFTEPTENLMGYSPLWLNTKNGLVRAEIDRYQYRQQGLILHLKDIDDRDSAQRYTNLDLVVPRDRLAALPAGDYYWYQLIGLNVISHFDGCDYHLGAVDSLLETGANDVLVIKPNADSIDNRERLVPLIFDLYIKAVDLQEQVVQVEWDPHF